MQWWFTIQCIRTDRSSARGDQTSDRSFQNRVSRTSFRCTSDNNLASRPSFVGTTIVDMPFSTWSMPSSVPVRVTQSAAVLEWRERCVHRRVLSRSMRSNSISFLGLVAIHWHIVILGIDGNLRGPSSAPESRLLSILDGRTYQSYCTSLSESSSVEFGELHFVGQSGLSPVEKSWTHSIVECLPNAYWLSNTVTVD